MPPGEIPPAASDCYRFIITNPDIDVCMTGPRNEDEMKEALRTIDLGPLDTDTLERMRKIGAFVHGKGKS
jgi:predicted aldo/keto reductase-like oxidoreductase